MGRIADRTVARVDGAEQPLEAQEAVLEYLNGKLSGRSVRHQRSPPRFAEKYALLKDRLCRHGAAVEGAYQRFAEAAPARLSTADLHLLRRLHRATSTVVLHQEVRHAVEGQLRRDRTSEQLADSLASWRVQLLARTLRHHQEVARALLRLTTLPSLRALRQQRGGTGLSGAWLGCAAGGGASC